MNKLASLVVPLSLFVSGCHDAAVHAPLDMSIGSSLDAEQSIATADAMTVAPDADSSASNAACVHPGCAIAWTALAPLPYTVHSHATFATSRAAQARVWIAGGAASSADAAFDVSHAEIMSARVNADGTLGEFALEATLASPLFMFSFAQDAERALLIGGELQDVDSVEYSASTLSLTFGADGRLADLELCPAALTSIVVRSAAAIVGDSVIVTGGAYREAGDYSTDTVMVGPLDGTDCVQRWEYSSAALPAPRLGHSAITHDGHVYIVGGSSGSAAGYLEVLRSVHDAEGVLLAWEPVGALASSVWTPAVFERNGELWVIGTDVYDVTPATTVVQHARFQSDGTLGAFTPVDDALPVGRAGSASVGIVGNRVYSAGGYRIDGDGARTLDSVHVGTFQ